MHIRVCFEFRSIRERCNQFTRKVLKFTFAKMADPGEYVRERMVHHVCARILLHQCCKQTRG